MIGDTANYGVATFHSTHSVIKAEKLLKDAGLESVRLVPVPSQVSSDCGITVRFLRTDIDRVREILSGLADDLEGFFLGSPEGWKSLS